MPEGQQKQREDELGEEPDSPSFEGQMVFKGDFDSDEDD